MFATSQYAEELLIETVPQERSREWWPCRLVCHLGDGRSLIRLPSVMSENEVTIETRIVPYDRRYLGAHLLVSWVGGFPKEGPICEMRAQHDEFWKAKHDPKAGNYERDELPLVCQNNDGVRS